MRDLEQQPYTADEKRVVEYLREAGTDMTTLAGSPRAAEDPIGFLISAHVTAVHAINGALDGMALFNRAKR